ncbi:uncharacterized protein V1518DRAFT_423355 [Limtongia smithiae]|uniref:uncharacterized protein n=1 Tax=Limtongia smithiae TaxID=1125753 RepID=UPI0034CFF240
MKLPKRCLRTCTISRTYTTTTAAPVPVTSDAFPPTVFSGIQPTGTPHLGNYLGALAAWSRLSRTPPTPTTRLIFSIVDMHALTAVQPATAEELREHTRAATASVLAAGVDPERCVVYPQSSVGAHAELCWVLLCISDFGHLARMTQWKSKLDVSTTSTEDAMADDATRGLKMGLFTYPVLQAADILLYNATLVPVGDDQLQHLELARHLSARFNSRYSRSPSTPILSTPRALLTPTPRIMSLKSPEKKMSKSDPSPASRIMLTDEPGVIKKKIRGATTDSLVGVPIEYDPAARPGIANLLEIAAGVRNLPVEQIAGEFSGYSYGKLKDAVAEIVITELEPVQKEYARIMADPGHIDSVLTDGARRANEIATATFTRVKSVVGLF